MDGEGSAPRWRLEPEQGRVPIVYEEGVLSPLAWPRKQQAVARGGVAKCVALFLDPLGLVMRPPSEIHIAGSPRNGSASLVRRRLEASKSLLYHM
jgi:hypothetical protein